MTDAKPPSEYGSEDSWDEDTGLECCAECGRMFGGEGGHHGEVWGGDGTHYEAFLNSERGEVPLFCPECWPKVDAARRKAENKSLGEWA